MQADFQTALSGHGLRIAIVFLCALGLGTAFTYVLKILLPRLDILRKPTADRWHKKPIPIFGGIGMFAAFALVFAITGDWNSRAFWVLFGLGSFMFAVGLVDDIFRINPPTKLVLQIVAASALVISGYAIPFTGHKYADMLISLFLVLYLTNAFNLLDNMDGLSAGVAIIVLLARGLFFVSDGDWQGVAVCVALIGAIGGFLIFNFNPASIFMGDCGSLFIGFTISAMFVISSTNTPTHFSRNLLYLLLLSIPLLDTFFVAITRKASGRKMSQGGKDHLSHRLVKAGLSERKAVLILYGIAMFVGGASCYVYFTREFFIAGTVGSIFVLFAAIFARYLVRHENASESGKKQALNALKYYGSFKYKRHMLQIAIDIACVAVSYYISYLLRFKDLSAADQLQNFLFSLFVTVPSVLLFLMIFGVYRGTWKYIGLPDALSISKGVVLGSMSSIFLLAFTFRFMHFSRGVFLVSMLIMILFLVATRSSYRLFDSLVYGLRSNETMKKIIIYGAGDNGESLLRLIRKSRLGEGHRRVIGFIDDDAGHQMNSIYGVPVLGTLDSMEKILQRHAVEEIFVSSTKIPPEKIERLKNIVGPIPIFRHEINLIRL